LKTTRSENCIVACFELHLCGVNAKK